MTDIRAHYPDAFAIVKLLVDEAGGAAVRLYAGNHAVFFATSLCFAETLGALKARFRHNQLSQEQYSLRAGSAAACKPRWQRMTRFARVQLRPSPR
jgi:predicted nucleic acid-binding protein